MDKILSVIEKNPRLSNKDIAVMLNIDEKTVEQQIKKYELEGVIKGYRALIDKDKTDSQTVTAFIEIKVQPKFENGFQEVAEKISALEEVESVYLMSGGFDLAVMVTDKSFKEVAMFVAKRLSPIDGVESTATHFILKKYKDQGIQFYEGPVDDRGNISF